MRSKHNFNFYAKKNLQILENGNANISSVTNKCTTEMEYYIWLFPEAQAGWVGGRYKRPRRDLAASHLWISLNLSLDGLEILCVYSIYKLNVSIKNSGSLQAYCKAENQQKKKAVLKMIVFFPVCKCACCAAAMHSPHRDVSDERQQEAVPLLSLQAWLMNHVSVFSWSRCTVPSARLSLLENAL